MKKTVALCLVAFLVCIVSSDYAFSWNEKVTHRDLSKYAADNSRLSLSKGDYLRNFGFTKGLEETLKWGGTEQEIRKWLQDGAQLEDASSFGFPIWPGSTTRSFNHFHNPLKLWDQAGLDDWVLGKNYTGKSSLLWAQDGSGQQGVVEGDWSWQKTRGYYYVALTSSADFARQENFAKTFRGLGHQMHLLQDTAVPDHVRNDAHPEDAIFGKNPLNGNAYFESWAKKEKQRIIDSAATPIFPDVSFNVSNGGLAPITQLYDTDQYTGSNPTISLAQGLAEYTNANFFSNDTIFSPERYSSDYRHYFPYPRKTSTDLHAYITEIKPLSTQIAEDGIEDKGIWIKKEHDGEIIDHFVRPSRWTSKIYKTSGESSLFYGSFYRDEKCHEDYASKLIPRAVGYSAGLLDYFFRGSIEVSLPASGIYAQTAGAGTGFSKITLLARNTTSNGDEMTDGSIEFVGRYRIALQDPFQSYPVPTTEQFSYVVVPEKNNVRSIPKDTPIELIFDAGQNTIIPRNATDVYIQVVYRGRLGNEDGAVAVGMKDISEPTPVDIFNNMDMICLNGNWYVAGSPEAIAQVDANHNGEPEEWDVFPHDIRDAYIRISSAGNPLDASPTEYTFHSQVVNAGALFRSYILTDIDSYAFNVSDYLTPVKIDGRDMFNHDNALIRGNKSGYAIRNQVAYNIEDQEECEKVGRTAPCDIRYYPVFYSFRGKNLWGPAGFIIDNPKYPQATNCSWDLLN